MLEDYEGTPEGQYSLAKVIPPRVGDKTFAATKNLISSISSEGHILSLEMVGTRDGVSLMHRAERDDIDFREMAQAHFPAAVIEECATGRRPAHTGAG